MRQSINDTMRGSVFLFIEKEFNIPTVSHDKLFGVTLADRQVADHLHVAEGHPLLEIENLIYAHQKKTV